MSPKAAKEMKAKSEKVEKAGKASAPAGKKAAKAPKEEEVDLVAAAPADGEEPAVDMEELEDAADESAHASSGGGGNAAALAAASSSTEMSASFKNFRHHPDMENFYRFIFENDLRHEALAIIDTMQGEKMARKMAKVAKLSAH